MTPAIDVGVDFHIARNDSHFPAVSVRTLGRQREEAVYPFWLPGRMISVPGVNVYLGRRPDAQLTDAAASAGQARPAAVREP
jgi:hypothetical protein